MKIEDIDYIQEQLNRIKKTTDRIKRLQELLDCKVSQWDQLRCDHGDVGRELSQEIIIVGLSTLLKATVANFEQMTIQLEQPVPQPVEA
jgi:hypothetical protein